MQTNQNDFVKSAMINCVFSFFSTCCLLFLLCVCFILCVGLFYFAKFVVVRLFCTRLYYVFLLFIRF